MSHRARIHIIDPKTLRTGCSVNDSKTLQRIGERGSGRARTRGRTPHNRPSASQTRKHHGLPDPSEFSKPGLLSSVLDRFLAQEGAFDDFHHEVVRAGIVARYQHALDLANNPEAFVAWKLEARILGLPRPPTREEDICRALFQASHRDPKAASKRFKRIEPLWIKRCSAEHVSVFLEENGVSEPSSGSHKLGPGKMASGAAKPNKTSKAAAGGDGDRGSTPALNKDDPPGGSFHLWPGKITVNKVYNLRVKVVDYDGDMSAFELLDVTPAPVQ